MATGHSAPLRRVAIALLLATLADAGAGSGSPVLSAAGNSKLPARGSSNANSTVGVIQQEDAAPNAVTGVPAAASGAGASTQLSTPAASAEATVAAPVASVAAAVVLAPAMATSATAAATPAAVAATSAGSAPAAASAPTTSPATQAHAAPVVTSISANAAPAADSAHATDSSKDHASSTAAHHEAIKTLPAAPPQEHLTLHGVELMQVVKGIALVSNVLLQLSPIRTIREIRQAGCTGEVDPLPIFVVFLSSANWFIYATVGLLLAKDIAMVSIMQAYIVGVVFGAFYVHSYKENCRDPDVRQQFLGMIKAGACLLGFEILCGLLMTPQTSLRVLGGICASFSIVVTASPLVAIEDIFRTHSVASMQTDMVIVCFCGSCAWTALGFMMHDVCVALPSCFGIVIGGLQVHLILKFSEASVWRNKQALMDLQSGRANTCPEKTGPEGYEASVYKSLKVFFLLAMAHSHFMLSSYLHFATSTLAEASCYLAEVDVRRVACFKDMHMYCQGGVPCGGGFVRRAKQEMGHEMGENINLL